MWPKDTWPISLKCTFGKHARIIRKLLKHNGSDGSEEPCVMNWTVIQLHFAALHLMTPGFGRNADP